METAIVYSTALASTTPILMGLNASILKGKYPPLKAIPRYYTTVFPIQFGMRVGQLALGSIVKQGLDSPWAGFGIMGVTQGIVYGHSNVAWMHLLKETRTLPWKNCLRGSPFAAVRDMISQGVPYHFRDRDSLTFTGVSIASIVATQGIHNCQTMMQTSRENLSHYDAVKKVYAQHGAKALYHGLYQRITLMGIINFLNQKYLDKVWG